MSCLFFTAIFLRFRYGIYLIRAAFLCNPSIQPTNLLVIFIDFVHNSLSHVYISCLNLEKEAERNGAKIAAKLL